MTSKVKINAFLRILKILMILHKILYLLYSHWIDKNKLLQNLIDELLSSYYILMFLRALKFKNVYTSQNITKNYYIKIF